MLKLVKFEELAGMLSLTKPSIDDYPTLKLLVASVYSAIEEYVGRNLERAQYSETVYVDGRMVPVRAFPIASVSSVVGEDGEDLSANLRHRDGYLLLSASYRGRVTATYTGGLTDVPPQLRRAALLQISHEWQRKEQVGATSVTTEGGSTYWPQLGLLKEVERLCDSLRHPEKFG